MRDLRNRANPQAPEDTKRDLSPYDVPRMLWELIQPGLEKYGVQLAEYKPQTISAGPTVVYRVRNRRPGNDKGTAHRRGPSMEYLGAATDDNQIPEHMFQMHTVWYDFSIYGESQRLIETIAWDLETSVVYAEQILRQQIPGFALVFNEQPMADSLMRSGQDDILVLTLIFEAQVPIRYTRHWEKLRQLRQVSKIGQRFQTSGRLTRTTDSDQYYVEQVPGQLMLDVLNIYTFSTSGTKQLILRDSDYTVARDSNDILYIVWDSDGLAPAVGSDFVVEYLQGVKMEKYITED